MTTDSRRNSGSSSCLVSKNPPIPNPLLADIPLPSSGPRDTSSVSSLFSPSPLTSSSSCLPSSKSSAPHTAGSSPPHPRIQPLSPRRPPVPASASSTDVVLPARRNFLRRLRRLDQETQLPSVLPFDRIILGFDFFEDIRDEAIVNQLEEASQPGGSAGGNALPASSPSLCHTSASGGASPHVSSAVDNSSSLPTDSPAGRTASGEGSGMPPDGSLSKSSSSSGPASQPSVDACVSSASLQPTRESLKRVTSGTGAVAPCVPTAVAEGPSAKERDEVAGSTKAARTEGYTALPTPPEEGGRTVEGKQKPGESLTVVGASTRADIESRREGENQRPTRAAKSDVLAAEELTTKKDTSASRLDGCYAKTLSGSAAVETVLSTEDTHVESSASSTPVAHAAKNDELRGAVTAEEENDSDDEFSTRHLQSVPTNFSSVEHYVDVFFPLFLQETKQAIQRAKKLEMGVSETCVQVQMKLDEGGDLLLTLERLPAAPGREADLAGAVYTYNDLILLSHPSISTNAVFSDGHERERQPAVAQKEEQEQEGQQQQEAAAVEALGEEGASAASGTEAGASGKDGAADGGADAAALQQQIHLLGIVQRVINKSSQGDAAQASSSSSVSSSFGLVVRVINPKQLWEEKNAYWRSRDLLRQQQKEAREAAAAAAAAGAAASANHKSVHVEAVAAAERTSQDASEKEGEQREESRRRQLLLLKRERQRNRLKAVVRYLCKDGKPVWNVRRVMNLTSMHREYQALMSFPDLHLINELLCAKKSGSGCLTSADERCFSPGGSIDRVPEGQSPSANAEAEEVFSGSLAAAERGTREAPASQQDGETSAAGANTALSSYSPLQQQQTALADGVASLPAKRDRQRPASDASGGEMRRPLPAGVTTYEEESDAAAAQGKGQDADSHEATAVKREASGFLATAGGAEQGREAGGGAGATGAAYRRAAGGLLRKVKLSPQPSGEEAAAAKREVVGEGTTGEGAERKEKNFFSIPPLLLKSLEKICNESQMQALRACLKYEGITLIQGPPGTGKTTTILALLSVLLNAQVAKGSSFSSSGGSRRAPKEEAAASAGAAGPSERDRPEPRGRLRVVFDIPRRRARLRLQTGAVVLEPSAPRRSPLVKLGFHMRNKATGELQAETGPPAAAAAKTSLTEEPQGKTEDELFFREQQQEECRRLLEAQPWLCMRNYTPWSDLLECSFEDLELPPSLPAAAANHERVLLDKTKTSFVPNRVLVCAPSNAAIDEIVKRLVQSPLRGGGILNAKGQRCRPSVVRVGPNVRPDLVRYSLEHMAQQLLSRAGTSLQAASIADIKGKILETQQVVCSTLSACGSRDIARCTFDTVVIDEASQGVEISTLIPLRLGCRRVILVGDPRQLPATIFSRLAIQHRYDQSLFERLEAAGQRVNLLSMQYRMHPVISKFTSQVFYQNQLKDAPRIDQIVQPPLPWYGVPIFKPLVFFSLNTSHQERNASFINVGEARFVCQLLDLIRQVHVGLGHQHWESRVAIISPYAEQVFYLRAEVKRLLGGFSGVDINTVDGFQGQEKDLIIFCAVRAEETGSTKAACTKTTVGFLADERRINVALTRGRTNLWIVGNGRFLMSNRHWRALWRYTKELGTLISIDDKYLQTDNLLKKWLLKFLNKNTAQKAVFEERLPSFLRDIGDEVGKSTADHSGTSLPIGN